MANYVRTGPFTNGGVPGIQATFLNAVESVFLRQSGDTEVGKYYFSGGAWGAGAVSGYWIGFVSRTTPLSATVDSSTVLAGYGSLTANNLDKSGFAINANATGTSTTARFGGNWQANY
jgi:hypothetical protein